MWGEIKGKHVITYKQAEAHRNEQEKATKLLIFSPNLYLFGCAKP